MSSSTLFYISVFATVSWLLAMKFKVHFMVSVVLLTQLIVSFFLWKNNVLENFASEPQDGDIVLNITDMLRRMQPYFIKLKDMITYRKTVAVESS